MESTSGESGSAFIVKSVALNIYLIQERFNISENLCNIWLLKGSKLDVIIDTGFGLWDLPGFLTSKGLINVDNEVLAVATHIHFDHTGGMYQFKNTAIHNLEYNDLKTGNNVATVTFLHSRDLTVKPYPGFVAKDYRVRGVNATRILEEGDVIDQGDRKLHVLHMPGHSKGSIVLYEPQNKYLFSGDVIYNGMLIDFVPGSNVDDYVDSFRRLQEMAPNINKIYPGHNEILSSDQLMNITDSYIQNATRCCKKCQKNCLKCLLSCIFKGKYTNNCPAKCFYYSCCCFCIV
eukprot:gene9934-10954_t